MANKQALTQNEELANALDTLVANIRFAGERSAINSLAVTSAQPGDGKTTVSIKLAQALAASGLDVLLVECDMHRRSLGRRLGARAPHGLCEVLINRRPFQEVVVATKTERLWLLDAESGVELSTEIFSSSGFRGLVRLLCRSYDFVICDTPPLGAFVDAALIGAATDATVLVARRDVTHRNTVAEAMEQLRKADVNVVGAVLNGV